MSEYSFPSTYTIMFLLNIHTNTSCFNIYYRGWPICVYFLFYFFKCSYTKIVPTTYTYKMYIKKCTHYTAYTYIYTLCHICIYTYINYALHFVFISSDRAAPRKRKYKTFKTYSTHFNILYTYIC